MLYVMTESKEIQNKRKEACKKDMGDNLKRLPLAKGGTFEQQSNTGLHYNPKHKIICMHPS